jgi:recombinational DNA repair protein RecT
MTKSNQKDAPPAEEKEPYHVTVRKALTGGSFIKLCERAVPRGVELDPLALVWQAINVIESPQDGGRDAYPLLSCDVQSIRRSVLKAATLGLQFQGECYLIAYGGTCNFQTSIWGELHIVERTGRLKDVWADVIYESDPYRIVLGERRELFHDVTDTFGRPGANIPIGEPDAVIPVTEGGRGHPIGAYACADLGEKVIRWDIMSEAEMAVARRMASSKNSPAHKNWPDEMRKKMALRRAQKKWPHTPLTIKSLQLEGDAKFDDETERQILTVEGQSASVQVPALNSKPATSVGDMLTQELKAKKEQRESVAPAENAQQPPAEQAGPRMREPGEN